MSLGPLVSVILPVHNCGPYLADAVSSVLGQTLGNLELVIIDDHSTDGAIAALPHRDQRLRIIPNPGRGLVDALNAGAAAARAPLLARMDGDDIALPRRFERQLDYLQQHPEVGIVGAQVETFADYGPVKEGYRLYEAWLNGLTGAAAIAREIFIESPIPHPTALIRAAVFDRLGGYSHRSWPEDYDLWLRAFCAHIPMGKPEGVLLRWRDREDRTSRQDPRYTPERFIRAKAHFMARTVLSRRGAILWGAGPVGAKLHDALLAESVKVTAFIDIDPKKIGGTKRGKPVFAPEKLKGPGPELIVGAVGKRGGRAHIRSALTAMGFREGPDFLLAA